MNLGKTLKYALPLLILLVVISFITFTSKKEPIRIGLMVTLTGIFPDLGREIRDGALLAVEMINEKGGINGRPVELIIRDNKFNHEIAKKNYEELLEEGVVSVIGPATSIIAKNLLPSIHEKKLLVIAPTPTSNALAGIDDHMIRLRPTTKDDAEAIANYVKGRFKEINNIAVVYDVLNPAYSIALIENLGNSLDVKFYTYPYNNRDVNFKNFSKKILSTNPDMVFIILDVYRTSLLIQNLRIIRPELPIFIATWAKSPKIVEFGGKWSEGVLTVDNIEFPLKGERGEEVRERFKNKYGREMDFASVNGFDSVMIIKKAIESGANRDNIKEIILKIRKFEGIQGDIDFDRFGDRVEKPFILKVENGQFKRLTQ